MKKIIVNGRFFSQTITGVQRYALELMKELDKLVEPEQVEIAVPPNAVGIPQFKNIRVHFVGKFHGHLWEQTEFPLYVWRHKGISVNLCNPSPLISPGIVCLHDARFKVIPQFLNKKFLLWYKLLFANAMRRGKALITTSCFSKSEFCKYYFLLPERMTVIPAAWQHYIYTECDEAVFDRYSLKPGEYFFSMSTLEPNKNFRWVAEVAEKNPEQVFVVAGSINDKVFANGIGFECPSNMKLLGFISDEEAKALMRDCKAFIYPSFYEGFGVPVLEALSVGATAIVSDASCMRSIYGNSVHYINPFDSEVDLEKLLQQPVEDAREILEKYSWEKSAKKLLEVVRSYA